MLAIGVWLYIVFLILIIFRLEILILFGPIIAGFLFGVSFCFPLFLFAAYSYHRVKKIEKGKLLVKVKTSPLETLGKKNIKKFLFAMSILCFFAGVFFFLISSSSFIGLIVIFLIFPLILRMRTDYEFYEKGIRMRARFISWKYFKGYKKDGTEIILIASIKHIWENLWKGNLHFEDKDGKIEKVVKNYLG